MKFRNPETDEIYDLKDGKWGVLGTGFCYNKYCKICPLGEINKKVLCTKWVIEHPQEAANLMGYEVIEEEKSCPQTHDEDKIMAVFKDWLESVDAVLVVRCKDCENTTTYKNRLMCRFWEQQVEENDFCSRGERKEG